MLVRPPRGFPPDFAFIDDLRHKNFVASRAVEDSVMTGPRLRQTLVKDLQALAPFVDYLCAALDLGFWVSVAPWLAPPGAKIGRASCRERGGPYGVVSWVAGTLKKKKH